MTTIATHFGARCVLLAALLCPAVPVVAGEGPLDGWRRLQLEGRRFWVASGKAVIERWPASGEGGLAVQRIETGYRALGKSRSEWAYSFVDRSETGFYRTRRWIEWSPGRKGRLGRLDARGRVDVVRYHVPAVGKGKAEPAIETNRWVEHAKTVYALPPRAREIDVLDAWSLLAMLGEMSDEKVLLLGKSDASVLTVRRGEIRELSLHLKDYDTGKKQRRRLQVVALEVEKNGDGGAFLGMQGKVKIWIERHSGALVEISGKVKGLPGTTRLTLTGFSRKPGRRPEIRSPAAPESDPG